ncbi:VOC family protein [Caldanaerobius polysaccharolyticus]|uniref:VOC family protein n=1 Tax=Caldanaerobius polysaccharolyticus TaxID=44256 RepID=UPI00047ECF70|nr:VOC family protein [Caldanaerobius polysaccharolyticus]
MEEKMIGSNVVTQIGIVVHDAEKTAKMYEKVFGIKPTSTVITDTVDVAKTEYKGSSTKARAKLIFFKMGSLDIELIEPDSEPSTWREFLDKHGEGVHHIAFQIKGMKDTVAALEANGMPLVQKGEYTGGRYAYIDAEDKLKVIVELLEND